jgi:hypothetical protein
VREPARPLPLLGARAVGGPVPLPLLATAFALALAGWVAAAAAAVAAAPDLAAADFGAAPPVLAAHLVALGVLPFAVTAASFHLLPVLLRNDVPRMGIVWASLPLLAGGYLAAPGVAFDVGPLVWTGAGLLAAGLAAVCSQVVALLVRAPRGRMLVTSRVGVALSTFHATAALALGAFVFAHGDAAVAGVPHDRWLLVHLHVALVGWIGVLLVAVGRTLVPMLAGAPAAPRRSAPVEELLVAGGLWLLAAGLATGLAPLALAGGAGIAAGLGRLALLAARSGLRTRLPLEAPLLHVLAGAAFLAEAAVTGVLALAGVDPQRLATAYVTLLLGGWAAGAVVAHLGKLLSLSVWVSWPPGPRPKQAELYPRRLWLAETAAFAAGVQCLAAGVLAGSSTAARAGAAALALSAAVALAGACATARAGRRRIAGQG